MVSSPENTATQLNATQHNTMQYNSMQHNKIGNQNYTHLLNKPVKVELGQELHRKNWAKNATGILVNVWEI